jgi:hypothetical protein
MINNAQNKVNVIVWYPLSYFRMRCEICGYREGAE